MAREETISFYQSDLQSASFAVFEDMRKETELCDITIQIRNSTLTAHRVILAAAIPYFRCLFGSSSSVSEGKEITMGDIDPTVLESLIEFAYTSRINISVENAQSLLVASEFLQVNKVKDACVEFLLERLNVHNVATLRSFALNQNNKKLMENTNIYMTQNFEVFCKSEDFLHLSHLCIKEIISKDDLRVSKEEIVFEAVMNWVKFAPQERENFLPELLSEVRMVHLDIGFLIKRVSSEDLIKASILCRDLVQNAQSYHMLPKEESSSLNLKIQRRTHGYTTSGIYAVCRSASHGYSVYCCDLIRCTWNLVKSDKLRLEDVVKCWGVVAVDESIYLFFENKMARFCLTALEWDALNSTGKGISGAAFLSCEKMIYCFGSYNPSFQNKVRCFDTRMKQWLKEDTMMSGRYCCAAASLGELVYVTGGRECADTILDSVEKYNPATGQLSTCSSMLHARDDHGCVTLNGKIYVCGGYSTTRLMDSAEVFDPLINKWNIIPGNICLTRCSLIPLNNKLFAFPRRHNNNNTWGENFQTYDEESGQWIKSSFPVPSMFIHAVLITVTDK